MKKYEIAALLSLLLTSEAVSQSEPTADEYYQTALEGIQKSETEKSETAKSVYESVIDNVREIEEIKNSLATAEPEELQALQVKLAILQATIQADALKLQSLSMIQMKDTKTKEEIREEQEKKKHKLIESILKEQLERSNAKF